MEDEWEDAANDSWLEDDMNGVDYGYQGPSSDSNSIEESEGCVTVYEDMKDKAALDMYYRLHRVFPAKSTDALAAARFRYESKTRDPMGYKEYLEDESVADLATSRTAVDLCRTLMAAGSEIPDGRDGLVHLVLNRRSQRSTSLSTLDPETPSESGHKPPPS